jgi:hypothetical protein
MLVGGIRAASESSGGIKMRGYCGLGTSQQMLRCLARGSVLFSMVLVLLACASNSSLNETADANGVPTWVNEGSIILTSKEGRRFHGVGSAPMLGDFSLQTATADNRARSEINRILASYVEIVSRDYLASGDAEESGFSAQHVAKQMDQLTNIDLTGIQVVGHWQDKQSNVIYSIAEIDMQQVRELIKSTESLHPGLRKFIKVEGDSIFDRIAKSED